MVRVEGVAGVVYKVGKIIHVWVAAWLLAALG